MDDSRADWRAKLGVQWRWRTGCGGWRKVARAPVLPNKFLRHPRLWFPLQADLFWVAVPGALFPFWTCILCVECATYPHRSGTSIESVTEFTFPVLRVLRLLSLWLHRLYNEMISLSCFVRLYLLDVNRPCAGIVIVVLGAAVPSRGSPILSRHRYCHTVHGWNSWRSLVLVIASSLWRRDSCDRNFFHRTEHRCTFLRLCTFVVASFHCDGHSLTSLRFIVFVTASWSSCYTLCALMALMITSDEVLMDAVRWFLRVAFRCVSVPASLIKVLVFFSKMSKNFVACVLTQVPFVSDGRLLVDFCGAFYMHFRIWC